MKKLYFVRHGQSEMNLAGRFAGTLNTLLTPEGKKQAKIAGKKAKKLNIDLIISSPLSRAHETAKIIAKEINYPEGKIELNPLLAERNYGVMEGQLFSPDIDMDGVADIEATDNLLTRASEAVASLQQIEADSVLVVSHGSIGRAIRHHLLEDFPYRGVERLPNAEIVRWI
jgi:probable phosphoglycerate mutase